MDRLIVRKFTQQLFRQLFYTQRKMSLLLKEEKSFNVNSLFLACCYKMMGLINKYINKGNANNLYKLSCLLCERHLLNLVKVNHL